MASTRRFSESSSKSKVSFESGSVGNKDEKHIKVNDGLCICSNNNHANLKDKPRSWMTSYNAGSHFIDESNQCESLPKRISTSNIPRESITSSLEVNKHNKVSTSLEFLKRNKKTSPSQSLHTGSVTTKISSSVFEHKHRGYSLLNFFTLRILFVDMAIAIGDPISDFMQVMSIFNLFMQYLESYDMNPTVLKKPLNLLFF